MKEVVTEIYEYFLVYNKETHCIHYMGKVLKERIKEKYFEQNLIRKWLPQYVNFSKTLEIPLK